MCCVLAIGPFIYALLKLSHDQKRKTVFLMPMPGYSNVGGVDLAIPYYLNLAPNYDATITPHLYTLRGMMLGGDFRFLTENSKWCRGGNFLPNDKAFNKFIINNQDEFPSLRGTSNDRWSLCCMKIQHFPVTYT